MRIAHHFGFEIAILWQDVRCAPYLASSFAAEKIVIRIGVQSGGTVEWELPVLQEALKASPADFQLDIHSVANAEAGKKNHHQLP